MPLSSFTGLPQVADGSQATTGLFNARYSILSQNLDQLNTAVSNFSSNYSGGIFSNLSDQWFNVQNYGAVGDGVTNDTAAIYSAVSSAISAGGGSTVYFPTTSSNNYIVNGLSWTSLTGIRFTGGSSQWSAPALVFSGSANSAVMELRGATYVSIENLRINGNSLASFGIYLHGGSSFECRLRDVFAHDCIRGISIGSTDNLQCSEHDLYNCIVSTCSYGLEITGQNTLNIRAYGLKADSCDTGIRISGGNLIATGTLFTVQSQCDIEWDSSERPNLFLGGQAEQGVGRFLATPANGNNPIMAFQNFYIAADSSSNTADFIRDSSLYFLTFRDCHFDFGAGVTFSGFTPVASNRTFGRKIFDNCLWQTSDDTATAPQIAGARTNVSLATEVQSFHF